MPFPEEIFTSPGILTARIKKLITPYFVSSARAAAISALPISRGWRLLWNKI